MWTGRLEVFLIHAVVADLRGGHRNDLTVVRRVREDFLVTGHAGVEHHFAAEGGFRPKCPAPKNGSIFKSEHSVASHESVLNDRTPSV